MFNVESRQDFATLAESLRLKDSFEPATSLIFGHLQKVQVLLHEFILLDPFVTNSLRQALAGLPERRFLRLLASPYLCELLMVNKEKTSVQMEPIRQQIVTALVAEIKLHDSSFVHSYQPKWTIDGDVVLDAKIAKEFPPLSTECGIRLNYQSYIHNTGKVGIGGFTFELARRYKKRVEIAKSLIEAVSISAHSLVDNFTTIIQFRINENRPNVVNSSTHTSIGLIRCDNFHKLQNDMPELVDMLVHESIHQYLHLFEEQLFDFIKLEKVPADLLEQQIFPSPWSGNLLDLRSYTHAILVWYGLANFWSDFVQSGYQHAELSQAQARGKLTEAMHGFVHSHSVLDNLGEYKRHLCEDFSAQVEQIQTHIRER